MISKQDTVLITGGTGFTGGYLVRALCATGARVKVVARPSSDRKQFADLPVEWHVGEVYDSEVIGKAMRNVNYVFHVAAAYREAKISDEIYWKVHVQSTQLLAAEATKQEDFKRFIHVSTVGVHGHIDQPPADEKYRFAPGDEYQNTKVEAEQWITRYAAVSKLPMTVVRPAAIYGPGDRRLLKVFKLAKLPVCPVLGIGCKGLYHLIHVEDLVSFMINIATLDIADGEVYICGNDEAVSIRDMIDIIGKHIGKAPFFLRLPVTPFFLLGDLCELICKPLNIEPPIYRRRVAFFTKDRSFNTSKMRNHTNFSYKYDNQSGLEKLADWYQQEGWL
jgi:nucleoside-diphosphate-sugar epimerase